MAERILDRLAEKMEEDHNQELKPCQTETTVLQGGVFAGKKDVIKYQLKVAEKLKALDGTLEEYAEYLVSNYGRQSSEIIRAIGEISERPENDLVLAELNFCLDNESTFTLLDFYERRTGRLYFHIDSIARTKRDSSTSNVPIFPMVKGGILLRELNSLDHAIKIASHFE